MTLHEHRHALAPGTTSGGFKRAALFWAALVAVVLYGLYLFSGVLMPFVAGFVLAYLLDPVVDRLERLGIGRTAATSIVLVTLLGALALLLVLLVPLLGTQLANLAKNLPGYIASFQEALHTTVEPLLARAGIYDPFARLGSSASELAGTAVSYGGTFLAGLWSRGTAVVDILSLLFVTPVVAFYLIQDWDRIVAATDRMLPRDHREAIHGVLRDMDRALAGFIRGQSLLCTFLAVWYAGGLVLVGLNFGVLIGVSAGVVSFIPYVGNVLGLGAALLVAFAQFGVDWPPILGVLAVFATGQFLEGNLLSPKLVGENVGLHPVWVIFALLAFGSLLGFVGLLIAVPLAAVLGVLLRFGLSRYLSSPLYAGRSTLLGERAERE